MKLSSDIRSSFLSFFSSHSHEVVRSSPLIPHNDPSLLFTNAGMVQFKDVFTGKEARPYKSAVTSQKCLRAGGKHNDLDNVGYTARHHTFFEMLGNFSFGDYFKDEAIEYAWAFLTQELQVPPEKLCITVYAEDDQAFSIWKSLTGFPDHKIIRIPTADNFWSMGDTGPCGPCSEIFYDHGDHLFGGSPGSKAQDGDRFVEIWNLVFMQYEQMASGERIPLPKPSIDTGMGLERISAVLQGVNDNFDTDIFSEIIQASKKLSPSSEPSPGSHKVIADHLRACSFLIADGVLPSSDGRGYVLRRILRRASRYAHMLGHRKPILAKLADVLIQKMGPVYNELIQANDLIKETLESEEERFGETLERGLKLLEEETSKGVLSGETAFKLYDTYGFPLDLTGDILRSKGMTVDVKTFDLCMEKQRVLGKKAWVGSGEVLSQEIPFEPTKRLEGLESEGTCFGWVDEFAVFDQSPFYGESGGQVGDTGRICSKTFEGLVVDTHISRSGVILHKIKIGKGELNPGDRVTLHVDPQRSCIAAHHSATHLLQASLRKILGNHVVQKGSLVSAEKLRFDFTHPKPVNDLKAIEDLVNQSIFSNIPSYIQIMPYQDALSLGAMALFGEKYADNVRVVGFGDFSTELCGGTHVTRTGDIGLFKIISEQGVSSGIRRIEAVCGIKALDYIRDLEKKIKDERIQHTLAIQALKKKPMINVDAAIVQTTLQGYPALYQHFETEEIPDLKQKADDLKKRIGTGLAIVTHEHNGKVSLVIGVAGDVPVDATVLVRKGVEVLGGKGGGGRKDLAQGGGNNPEKLNRLMEILNDL